MRRATSQPPELPGYRYVQVLGSGGFSDVFLYEQQLPKRRVAVKVLLTDELSGANRAAFVAEANLMAQLSAHPYIVSIFHADVAGDDRPYFVMEYCSGPSLAERYKREPLSVVDVLRTGIRVAGAVATAHGAGILHRDIKPANILFNDFGWPALTDFGISSTLDDELPVHTTTIGEAAGDTGGTESASVGMSIPWSPPEMFADDPRPDVRSDVFSLAATLYTLLAGQTPFEVRGRSNGALDLIGRIERGVITPLERTDVPRSLVAVLQKGMASRREDRFATVIELARALQRVELELKYAPTTIDVPNLTVDDSVRAGVSVDDDDATRARGVATIEAQPVSAFVPPPAPAPAADATVARSTPSIIAQPPAFAQNEAAPTETVVRRRPAPQAEPEPVATPVVEAPPAEEPPRPPVSKANKVAMWVGGGVVLLVAAGVAISAVLLGPPSAEDPDPTTKPGGGDSAVVDIVPTPVFVSAAEQNGSLVMQFENPKPLDGDRILWRGLDAGTEKKVKAAEAGAVVLESFASGTRTCVEVFIVRDGKQSANPLEQCYPS